ncbi:MAG: BACON domain-containing protein, partial [Gemmatimonadales bacterium]
MSAFRSVRHLCLLGATALLTLSVACRLDMLLKPTATPLAVLTITPAEVQDTARAHSGDEKTVDVAITNSGGGTFTWTASDRSDWIRLDPREGEVPGTLELTLDPEDLGPGVYQGEVTVIAKSATDSQSATIAVTFVVQRPGLNVTPTSIDRSTTVGSNQVFSEALQISNNGTGQLTWTASKDKPWLTLGATSGTGDASLPVAITSSGLAGGTYTGEIVISAPGATGSPARVAVILTVLAPGLAVTPG